MDLRVRTTPIEGLLVVDLPMHGDDRGWFKENWQREKMVAAGLPDFGPVQHSVAYNAKAGTTRGIHAEPWDKFVSVVAGRVFGAWVDLRSGDGFGTVFTTEVDEHTAVFVPRGVANSYQTLRDDTVYSYLVNAHWSADATYTHLNLADETVAIPWPIDLSTAEISDKDRSHPALSEVTSLEPRRVLVLGANGQIGRALVRELDDVDALDRNDLDLTDVDALDSVPWHTYSTVVNAAAYTAVDAAETSHGRREAWAVNVTALSALVRCVRRARAVLVHISSDYVFDGTEQVHQEDEPMTPLGVYGQTKAAGELLVAGVTAHYVIRTSWVIGDGKNFVATMLALADQGACPTVVADQYGRLSFASDIARGIRHLLQTSAPFGTYNLTSSGPVMSWADVARTTFELAGRNRSDVAATSTADYGAGKSLAPRPQHGVLDLSKIERTGFVARDSVTALTRYVADRRR